MSDAGVHRLYTAAQSRAVDRCAIDELGLPGPVLMARAARAAFILLCAKEPAPALIQVLCGSGNNGGDGLLLAVLAQGRAMPVRVFLIDGEPRSDDARQAADRARAAGIELQPFDPALLENRGVVVDAMLGTGISGAPRAGYGAAIDAVNALDCPVLAVDVPSGVDSDTGHAAAAAIGAAWTMSFITAKRGLFTGLGQSLAGERQLDDLDVPEAAYLAAGETCAVLNWPELRARLPARLPSAHKGDFGRCLLIGGDRGMGGAVIMAAEAALRCGVGLARAATRGEHLPPLLARRPECMATAVEHRSDLEPLLPWADVIVVGPGLGMEPWAEQLLQAALDADKPLLVDADALNLCARRGVQSLPPGSVITPHPGEAARLLGCDTAQVQSDRFAAVRALARQLQVTVVLKGNGSLVSDGECLALCREGNPGMASGGMGDVLSGIIGSLLAQGLPAWDAARLGTLLHARAADTAAAQRGAAALLAADLFEPLGDLLA